MLESAEHKSTENPDLEQTVLTQSSPDNKISTDVETIELRNKLERLTAEVRLKTFQQGLDESLSSRCISSEKW